MGKDLSILPQAAKNANYSHSLLRAYRDNDFYEAIVDIENRWGREVDPKEGIDCHCARSEDDEYTIYGNVVHTDFNENGEDRLIMGVPCGKLVERFTDYVPEDYQNRAIIAYLKELPPYTEIWLFWH